MREAVSIICIVVLCAVAIKSDNEINDWRPVFGPPRSSHGLFQDTSALLDRGATIIRHDEPQPQALTLEEEEPRSVLSAFPSFHQALPKPDRCSADKFAFDEGAYIQYRSKIPNMKEFTLCLWSRFYNHSTDHPLFSYSVADEPRELSLWVNNARGASYFSMAVAGHTLYRLNYPLALDKWHHLCTSWNGRTGEWQLWVRNERVGRGFNNRLVGHVIQGGGSAISGQEQGGVTINTPIGHPVGDNQFTGFPQPPGSLMGEITMLQLYRVALSAGKAHRDHKHHHVHKFNHNGVTTPVPTEPPATPAPPQQVLPGNTIYTNGQLMRPLMLNLGGGLQPQPQPQPQPPTQSFAIQLPNGQTIQQQLVNGQLTGRLISEQLTAGSQALPQPQALQQLLDPNSLFPQFQLQPQPQQPQQPQQRQAQTNAQQFPLPTNQPPPEQIFQQFLLPQPHLQQPAIFPALPQPQQPQPQQPQPQQTQPQRRLRPSQVQFTGGFSGQVAQPVLQYPQIQGGLVHRSLTQPANVQILEGPPVSRRFLFKRDETSSTKDAPAAEEDDGEVKILLKRSKRTTKKELTEKDFEEEKEALAKESERLKRALVQLPDGSIVDDGSVATDENGVGLAQYGLAFGAPLPQDQQQQQGANGGRPESTEDEIKEHDREPAEAEVREVLNLCSACGEEPFEKALVLGWARTRKTINGALRAPAISVCGFF